MTNQKQLIITLATIIITLFIIYTFLIISIYGTLKQADKIDCKTFTNCKVYKERTTMTCKINGIEQPCTRIIINTTKT